MQALTFVHGLNRVVTEMRVRELIALMQPWLVPAANNQIQPAQKDQFTQLIFNSHSGYERLLQDQNTKELLNQLDASQIYEPSRMAKMLSTVSTAGTTQNIWGNPTLFTEFYTFLALLKSLETMRESSKKFLEDEKIGVLSNEEGTMEIELLDYDGTGIEPKRFQILVNTLLDLNTNLARIYNVGQDTLRFQYFDSGSSVLVGIKAAKPIIDGLNTLLMQWWDKIRFRQFDSFDRKVEAIAKGLTITHTIQEAVNRKVIDEETGQNLKRRVLTEVDTLIGIGASLPLRTETAIDERRLLAGMRSTKLLGSGELADQDTGEKSE
jgi:hypothetical protein